MSDYTRIGVVGAGLMADGGSRRSAGDLAGVTDLALPQPGFQGLRASRADRRGGSPRGLVAAQQDQRPGGGQVQRAFQGREDRGQQAAQSVDEPGPVGDQVRAPRGQQLQLGRELIPGPQRLQVPAYPRLVSDDDRVLGVGLAIAPVTPGSPVDSPARDVFDNGNVCRAERQMRRRKRLRTDRPVTNQVTTASGDGRRSATYPDTEIPLNCGNQT